MSFKQITHAICLNLIGFSPSTASSSDDIRLSPIDIPIQQTREPIKSMHLTTEQSTVYIEGTHKITTLSYIPDDKSRERCQLTKKLIDGILHVDYSAKLRTDRPVPLCKATFAISLPKKIELDIQQQSGTVLIDGMKGPLNIKMDIGTIIGFNLSGKTRAHIGYGLASLIYQPTVPIPIDIQGNWVNTALFFPQFTSVCLKNDNPLIPCTNEFLPSHNPMITVTSHLRSGDINLRTIQRN